MTDDENLDTDEDTQATKTTLQNIETWRKHGPLGMLHNIIVYIQASPVRMQNFLRLSRGRRPARDNKTRWNSWERMLKIALSPPVYDAILAYFRHYRDDEIALDELSAEQWEILKKIHTFLDDVAQTTKALESNESSLDNVLTAMDYVLDRFETMKEEYKDDPIIASMVNSGWSKMEKYYNLTDESPAYIIALVLNPSMKWAYVQQQWKAEWLPRAREMVLQYWKDNYKPLPNTAPRISTDSASNPINKFKDWKNRHTAVSDIEDEYARYCASEPIFCQNARKWWLEPTQQENYPNLSKMAVDILTIPSMSAAPERLFSETKLTLTDLRNRLGMELLEAFQCLRSWYRMGEWSGGNFALEQLLAQE